MVRRPVPHQPDIPPWRSRLCRQQITRVTAFQVATDSVEDLAQPVSIASSHSGIASTTASTKTRPRLEAVGRRQVDVYVEDLFQASRSRVASPNKAGARDCQKPASAA